MLLFNKVDYGNMNKRITIQKYTSIEGEWGQTTTQWIDFTTVWASINSLFGKEFWEAKQCNLENSINITIRYQKALKDLDTREYRVKWDNKIYNIINIDNPYFKNKYLTLKCVEVVS